MLSAEKQISTKLQLSKSVKVAESQEMLTNRGFIVKLMIKFHLDPVKEVKIFCALALLAAFVAA